MFTGKTKIDKAIQDNIDRWQKLARDPIGPTNEPMGEEAIRQIYNICLKKKPGLIVWCDSPYQMATLPVLITNLVEGPSWSEVCGRMGKHRAQSPSWEQQWRTEWQRLLETELKELIPKVLHRPDFFTVDLMESNAAIAKLHVTLREGLAADILPPGSMAWKKPQKTVPGRPMATPFEWEFFKHQSHLFQKIAMAAGLKFDALSANSWIALATGSFDARLVARLIPAAKDIVMVKLPDEVSVAVEHIRQSCNQFEQSYGQMNAFYSRLPAREPEPTPDFEVNPEASFDVPEVLRYLKRGISHAHETNKRLAQSTKAPIPLIFWVPFVANWLPFALSCRLAFPDIFKELDQEIDCWALLSHAAAGYCFTEPIAFACRKPLILHLNQNDRPHNDKGPAMVWRDGYSVYAWRGVVIRGELLTDKRKINVEYISKNQNAELRRVLIDLYGEVRYLEDAGAKLIDKDVCGELYRLDMRGDESMCMVKVINSTAEPDGTYKTYFLRVPPYMKTAKQAVAWTFDMSESEYQPKFQS